MKKEITTPKTPMTYNNIMTMVANGTLYLHHSAYFRGYVSRKLQASELYGYPYKGRFGTGYTVDIPTHMSTRYSVRLYFIFNAR